MAAPTPVFSHSQTVKSVVRVSLTKITQYPCFSCHFCRRTSVANRLDDARLSIRRCHGARVFTWRMHIEIVWAITINVSSVTGSPDGIEALPQDVTNILQYTVCFRS